MNLFDFPGGPRQRRILRIRLHSYRFRLACEAASGPALAGLEGAGQNRGGRAPATAFTGGEASPALEECMGGRGRAWRLCSYPWFGERWSDGKGRLLPSG